METGRRSNFIFFWSHVKIDLQHVQMHLWPWILHHTALKILSLHNGSTIHDIGVMRYSPLTSNKDSKDCLLKSPSSSVPHHLFHLPRGCNCKIHRGTVAMHHPQKKTSKCVGPHRNEKLCHFVAVTCFWGHVYSLELIPSTRKFIDGVPLPCYW